MNIKEISQEIHANNVAKGFWETERNTGEMLMLVVSELSEALEADRKGKRCDKEDIVVVAGWSDEDRFKTHFLNIVKDSFEDEIADAIIRLFDLCVGLNIDIESHIYAKLRYNKTRPYKHNKAY